MLQELMRDFFAELKGYGETAARFGD